MKLFRAEYIVTLIILLGAIAAGGIILFQEQKPGGTEPLFNSSKKSPYVEIVNPSGFVNTDPLTIGELIGKKVVLVDFMTYSCINCQRTFPHMKAWYEKYASEGLQIVAIHTPEFAFEKNIENVREAMKKNGITYPVVLDNDYGTWNAYGNRYWPRKYLIDIEGNIVYDHIGEGGYVETEMKIQELLRARAEKLGNNTLTSTTLVSAGMIQTAPRPKSPETYFGSLRNDTLGSGIVGTNGLQTFSKPEKISKNTLYLVGDWEITPEYAKAAASSRILYSYEAKEVYFVARADVPVTITVLQDGKPLTEGRGADVAPDGTLRIKEDRLYTIISNPSTEAHTLELRVDGELEAFTFTFG